MAIVITHKTPHKIMVDGVCKGVIFACREKSPKLKYYVISCVSGKAWKTFEEACEYARKHVKYEV